MFRKKKMILFVAMFLLLQTLVPSISNALPLYTEVPLRYEVTGDLTPSGLSTYDTRKAWVSRHEIRFRDVINNTTSSYYPYYGFQLVPEPGEDFGGKTGYFIQPTSKASEIASLANGNPQFVNEQIASQRDPGGPNNPYYTVDGIPYVNPGVMIYYSGGMLASDTSSGSGYNVVYQATYNISPKPKVEKFAFTTSSAKKSELNNHKLELVAFGYSANGMNGLSGQIEIISGPERIGFTVDPSFLAGSTVDQYTFRRSASVPLGFMSSWKAGTYTFKFSGIDVFGRSAGPVNATITIIDDDGTPPPEPEDPLPPIGGGGYTINPPSPGARVTANHMSPNATGQIRADGSFNVSQGIPTSETLNAQVSAASYLAKHTFTNMSGKVVYQVPVRKTYTLKWQESVKQPDDCSKDTNGDGKPDCVKVPDKIEDKSETQVRDTTVTIERPYSYWQIDNLEVYSISYASLSNYALPNTLSLFPSGYSAPSVSASNSDAVTSHVFPAPSTSIELTGTLTGGLNQKPQVPDETNLFKSEAEAKIGKTQVRNDSVVFNGMTIMDGSLMTESTNSPSSIPYPGMIGSHVLYQSGIMIPSSKQNQANTGISGTISYSLVRGIKGGSGQTFGVTPLNTVTVHTPVVNYSSSSNDAAHNQKTVPSDRPALILDRPFTITIPNSGQHLSIPGYGNRNYAKYIRAKEVQFPFDVYMGSTFYAKNQWINLSRNQESFTFTLPTWVEEGFHNVYVRVTAENAGGGTGTNANTNVSSHIATNTIPVEVIGRLFDFKVTDIHDFAWEEVFRTAKGSSDHSGNVYWAGDRDIDGNARGNTSPYLLPIRQGSHPSGIKNLATKTGYGFKFEIKTKGNMFGATDLVRVKPRFYFVNKDGKDRREVDLYYRDETNFIQLGSNNDPQKRYLVLGDRLRNVPNGEIQDTATALTTLGQDGAAYLANIMEETWIGKYSRLLLPPQVRTFVGSKSVPAGVNSNRSFVAVQKWYGEYGLPPAPYIVEKGTDIAEYGRTNDLHDNAPIFLRDGYLIVNFDIETIRNGDLNNPHLQYIHGPLNNQWRKEGFRTTFTDPYGKTFNLLDGDIIFYYGDQSSYDDFAPGVTH